MRAKMKDFGNRRQLESILLICGLVTMGIVILIPMTAPEAKAVTHLMMASMEDGNATYDMDGVANGIVVWNASEDHIINPPLGNSYIVDSGYTLNIPALNYETGEPWENTIEFQGVATNIQVYGTLITNTDGNPATKTLFTSNQPGGWDSIYFHAGSKGIIQDTLIRSADNGVVFSPGSQLMAPGVSESRFEFMGDYGLRMDGALGFTNIVSTEFDDSFSEPSNAVSLEVANGQLNISESLFTSHGIGLPSIHISDAEVNLFLVTFDGNGQPGNEVYIEGDSNGTVLDHCEFMGGSPGDHFIRANGTSNLIDNCTFDTSGGARTVFAEENALGPAHAIVLNPNPGSVFDNSSFNATGDSSVTLQWYLFVNVDDPDGNPIPNIPVTINSTAPLMPTIIQTDGAGWINWFRATELIQYNGSVSNFNPYNVSAVNVSVTGYADPEPVMDMTRFVYITVPFSTEINLPPVVSWLPTPSGVQGGDITIEFILADPNGDSGYLSVVVEWSLDNSSWVPATAAPGSDPISNLLNNTLYYFIWDSEADIGGEYNTTVYIRITPSDLALTGPPRQTGNFTVDNNPPQLVLPPGIAVTDTTATITWRADQPCDATVWYGLDTTLTDEMTNNSGTTLQSVTITGLRPGSQYSVVVNSTDENGLTTSSYPTTYKFNTEVHIQLYVGWNMISIPPDIPDPSIAVVLDPIKGLYDAVQWYDALDPTDPWKNFIPSKPFGNDLEYIYPNMGIWIYMNSDAVFILDHALPTGESTLIPLVLGWNFVGYPSVTTTPVNVALSGVSYDLIQTYDAATGQWWSYNGFTGDLTNLKMGRGYWIHVTVPLIVWEVYYV